MKETVVWKISYKLLKSVSLYFSRWIFVSGFLDTISVLTLVGKAIKEIMLGF